MIYETTVSIGYCDYFQSLLQDPTIAVKSFPSVKLSNAAARMGGEGGILEEDEETAAATTTGADRTRYKKGTQ